jgi:hypothetical protein
MASGSWVTEPDLMAETGEGQPGSHTTVTDNGCGSERPMVLHQASPTWLLIVLSAATLPTALSVVMLGPLLVPPNGIASRTANWQGPDAKSTRRCRGETPWNSGCRSFRM